MKDDFLIKSYKQAEKYKASDIDHFDIQNGEVYDYDINGEIVLKIPQERIVNSDFEKIHTIKQGAFYNKGLNTLIISKNIKKIQAGGFSYNRIKQLIFLKNKNASIKIDKKSFVGNNIKQIFVGRKLITGPYSWGEQNEGFWDLYLHRKKKSKDFLGLYTYDENVQKWKYDKVF